MLQRRRPLHSLRSWQQLLPLPPPPIIAARGVWPARSCLGCSGSAWPGCHLPAMALLCRLPMPVLPGRPTGGGSCWPRCQLSAWLLCGCLAAEPEEAANGSGMRPPAPPAGKAHPVSGLLMSARESTTRAVRTAILHTVHAIHCIYQQTYRPAATAMTSSHHRYITSYLWVLVGEGQRSQRAHV